MQFYTERLILKTSDPSMAKEVLQFYIDNADDFSHVEPIDTSDFYTFGIQQRNLRVESRLIAQNKLFRFWIYLKSNPEKPIGTFSLQNLRKGSFLSASLGYKMDRNYRKMGYCSEAIRFGISFSSSLGLHRLNAIVLPDNTDSIHLLERNGFEKEGLLKEYVKLKGVWRDHYLYSRLL